MTMQVLAAIFHKLREALGLYRAGSREVPGSPKASRLFRLMMGRNSLRLHGPGM